MLLRVEQATIAYDAVVAVYEATLTAADSAITIIGANGAGKTTLLRAISGLKKISSGAIYFDEQRIDGLSPEDIIARGIAHVPEGRRVFPDMTVEENLRLGAFLRQDQDAIESDLMDIYRRFSRLQERRKQHAKTMSGGEQQMLAIGRALMSRPRLLLLDEPSMGLSPVMTEEIVRVVEEVRARGVSVVLVEQNAELALSLADYGYVLESGRVALEGASANLHDSEHVRKAYLGG